MWEMRLLTVREARHQVRCRCGRNVGTVEPYNNNFEALAWFQRGVKLATSGPTLAHFLGKLYDR